MLDLMPTLPMFPLGTVLLPGGSLPLRIFEPRYVAMIERCLAGDRLFGVVLIARGSEVGGGDERTDVGTVAHIVACEEMTGGRFALRAVATERFRVVEWLPDDPYPQAVVEAWPDADGRAPDWVALDRAVDEFRVALAAVAAKTGRRAPKFTIDDVPADASQRSFALGRILPISDADRQRVLAAPDPAARVGVLADALGDVTAGLRFRIS